MGCSSKMYIVKGKDDGLAKYNIAALICGKNDISSYEKSGDTAGIGISCNCVQYIATKELTTWI